MVGLLPFVGSIYMHCFASKRHVTGFLAYGSGLQVLTAKNGWWVWCINSVTEIHHQCYEYWLQMEATLWGLFSLYLPLMLLSPLPVPNSLGHYYTPPSFIYPFVWSLINSWTPTSVYPGYQRIDAVWLHLMCGSMKTGFCCPGGLVNLHQLVWWGCSFLGILSIQCEGLETC